MTAEGRELARSRCACRGGCAQDSLGVSMLLNLLADGAAADRRVGDGRGALRRVMASSRRGERGRLSRRRGQGREGSEGD